MNLTFTTRICFLLGAKIEKKSGKNSNNPSTPQLGDGSFFLSREIPLLSS